ncbi:MAG: alpha/beta fold hydrolase [Novosphingobium sp.]|nr:alpha/beta fold hydrolase [Novosphingobium sp.]
MAAAIEPFTLNIAESELDDLKRRLADTRWPDAEVVDDWTQGAPLAKVRALCDYWQNDYDWRRCETMLNGIGQYRTEIEGLGVHFLHARSPEPNALPVVITHGWPGSVMEFHKVIGPLTDPAAHGGDPADAFHVVAPSLLGYGFSDKPTAPGFGVIKMAEMWAELMTRLGYDRWVAQGGDWGSAVTSRIGANAPDGCLGIHLNMVAYFPTGDDLSDLSEEEKQAMVGHQHYFDWDSGYSKQQSTRPQSLGYGLNDSPVGQAAWIYEKLWAWTDNQGAPEDVFSLDEMLDNIMLYWLPGAGTSSGRLYWESMNSFGDNTVRLPTGVSNFPKEIMKASRRWAEKQYPNITYWNETEKGGHFAAWEQPEIFVREVRDAFRALR